ncbi:MAG: adenylate/guanylate cyclase protein [Enterovirga sp.]|nr:adenylate/guanylate cyclase protein [Enterovirga sp.]
MLSMTVLRRARITVRGLRLASGLVLLAYVSGHLLNHALGNVSLGAMEAALGWISWFWGLPGPGWALYGALAVHLALALWAIYERPRYRWTLPETLQLALGLSLPFLLAGHVTSTRLAYELFGDTRSYAQQLYLYWVAAPDVGAQQALTIVVAWTHACIGLHLWLRLKRGFATYAPLLLCVAVLVPVLSLLGFAQGGRAVAALAADEGWRLANAALPTATIQHGAELDRRESLIRWTIAAAFLLAVAARGVRRLLEGWRGLVRVTYPDGRAVRVPRGTTVLEASRIGRIAHAGVCGGKGRCSTCRVRVFGESRGPLPKPGAAEQAVLDRIGAGPQVRLACQLRPTANLQVAPLVSPHAGLRTARRVPSASGEERFVVAMFVDMRGSTRFAETHLPFDTVFVINRFLDAVAQAVQASGGVPNQFLGDGLLALFGLEAEPRIAAEQALAAVSAIGRGVAALNILMAGELAEPIRFGIGVHAGTAILGEIGGRATGRPVFTAIGDPVNVAARLQSATKRFGVEALISDAVYGAAGVAAATPPEQVTLDGREGAVAARALARAEDAAAAGSRLGTPG